MSVDIKVRRLILRCFQNGFSPSHASTLVGEKFGVRGYARRTCQRWYRKFRDGDFNLFDKPTHDRKAKRKPEQNPNAVVGRFRPRPPPPPPQVKVERTTFQQENQLQDNRNRTSAGTHVVVQRVMHKGRQLTVSRVQPAAISVKEAPRLMSRRANTPPTSDPNPNQGTIRVKAASKLMSKRISLPSSQESVINQNPGLTPPFSPRRSSSVVLQQRRPAKELSVRPQSRLRNSLRTDLRLPPSIVKRMGSTRFSTEKHTINEAVKGSQKGGETTKKSITVQFQNVSPEVAKSTVRKSTESAGQSSTSGSKKLAAQSSNPLASPKGVIYLNPQEIFGEKLPPKNSVKKAPLPLPMPLVAKPPSATTAKEPAKSTPPAAKPTPPAATVTVEDSDSDDDLLFPKDVSLPPPKVKAVVNTFTTYWDMETDKPILLNPTKDMVSTLPVIELE